MIILDTSILALTATFDLPDKAAPEQHVVQIASQRSEADVLAVFRSRPGEGPLLLPRAH